MTHRRDTCITICAFKRAKSPYVPHIHRRQSAWRHYAHRDGQLLSAPVQPAQHRRLLRRPLRESIGRRRRGRAGGAEHRRDRSPARLRLPAAASPRSPNRAGPTTPFARGSYSHALPGHAGDRAVLAAPVDGRLFFAGEATSPNFFSTAHGARDSGERAAGEVLSSGTNRS